jgi:glycosidase
MEFHISREIRDKLAIDDLLFSYTGNVVFADVAASRRLAQKLSTLRSANQPVNAGALFAMGLIDEFNHALIARYRKDIDPAVFTEATRWLTEHARPEQVNQLLLAFTQRYPNVAVYRGQLSAAKWLTLSDKDPFTGEALPNREAALEELLLLWLANTNPGFAPFKDLFDDTPLAKSTIYKSATASLPAFFQTRPPFDTKLGTLLEALRAPQLASPDSLTGQLDYIREQWEPILGPELKRALLAIDVIREEDIAIWMRFNPAAPDNFRHGAPGGAEGFVGDEYVGFDEMYETGPDGKRRLRQQYATDYQAPLVEYEAFSADQAWMPNVVLMAKSTYVWLEQLSKKYGRHIHRLDHVPDEELELLATRGITGLWLIGLWERSIASRTIKHLRGHSDAVASAYSLKEYNIAEDLGGNYAYENLRDRAQRFGLRLASDMVPNHMGIDSPWVIEHPDWFIYRNESPFPSYSFNGPDLSTDSRVEIKLEDHYYDQTDAAVAFRLRHHADGSTRYIYHGNDGTTFAWNDTAQLDYSKAYVREHVIQTILHVARQFPIIRFDAAMVLAKRHVQRLWFPLPGAGGSIPSRAENAMSQEDFDAIMPHEFWREVVDRVAVEVPGTLLLAEAFWMLEGYFVRTLGMHRVYNSAFMNMLRDEENAKYRNYLKKTIEFDPDILKRYVNFMSNPDERTTIDQFGSGDKCFGVATLMATLPGLPMFGHGQIEGYTERYGMEFKQAKMDEWPNEHLVARHQHEIAPLLHARHIFAESHNFLLYDLWTPNGTVDENVFAYSNRNGWDRSLILYNNAYNSTRGTIHHAAASVDKGSGELRSRSLADGLALNASAGIVYAFRDRARGLEYLRHGWHLHDNGFSLDLRGYQYAVLLDWRELHSTAEQPWDRLCDSLHGAGVHSVDEAMADLRLQPVHEALRSALSHENIREFQTLAESKLQPTPTLGAPPATGLHPVSGGIEQPQKPGAPPVQLHGTGGIEPPTPLTAPPSLANFTTATQTLIDRILEQPGMSDRIEAAKPSTPLTQALDGAALVAQGFSLGSHRHETPAEIGASAPEVTAAQPSAPPSTQPPPSTPYSLLPTALLSLSRHFSDQWPAEMRLVLPCEQSAARSEAVGTQVWAPVVAWLLLRSLPPQLNNDAVFDQLRLRSVLAEIFSAFGLEGDDAWRAAARVRILLSLPELTASTALSRPATWQNEDIRWLAGVTESDGITYVNEELFAALLSWLQLPALLWAAGLESETPGEAAAKALPPIESVVAKSLTDLHTANFQLEPYLHPPEPNFASVTRKPRTTRKPRA